MINTSWMRKEIKQVSDEPNNKVKIYYLHYTRIEQELHEDDNGLYTTFQGQRLACSPALNNLNEPIPGVYIGLQLQIRPDQASNDGGTGNDCE